MTRPLCRNNDLAMILENLHGEKYCYACDWLQYSVLLQDDSPELLCPDNFRLEIMQGNSIFKHRAILWNDVGVKFLTLLWSPYSSLLNPRIMTVQLANQHLYNGGIYQSLSLVQAIVDCEFNSLGRVDVCCDFEVKGQRLDVLKSLASGSAYVQGKSEGSQWWHSAKSKALQTHCLSWGSAKSEIKVKCYNKSREQGVLDGSGEPEKPWIVERWRDAGFDISDVWRLEFSLHSVGQLRWQGRPMSLVDVDDDYFLARVFGDMYARRFVVRRNQGGRGGHKNTDAIVPFLSLPDVPDARLRWQGVVKPLANPDAIVTLRKLVSLMSSPSVVSNATIFDSYYDCVSNLIRLNHLDGYFLSHWGCDFEAYAVSLQSGDGCVEVVASPRV